MLVLAMPIGMATTTVIIPVITTVVTAAVTTVVFIALVAHVVAQRATRAAACGCAESAANGCFAAAALVGANRTAARAAQGRTDGRTGVTADLLADNRTEYPAQCAAHTGFGGATGHGCATDQSKGQQENRGELHRETSRG